MICERTVKKFCKELTKIENYEKAVADSKRWECHHRLELVATGGVCDVDMQDLIDWGIYFDRPADELIFLTASEHRSLHKKGKTTWSKGKKLEPLSEECKRKISEAHKGKTLSEETKRKISAFNKGKHWKIVEGKRVWY